MSNPKIPGSLNTSRLADVSRNYKAGEVSAPRCVKCGEAETLPPTVVDQRPDYYDRAPTGVNVTSAQRAAWANFKKEQAP